MSFLSFHLYIGNVVNSLDSEVGVPGVVPGPFLRVSYLEKSTNLISVDWKVSTLHGEQD